MAFKKNETKSNETKSNERAAVTPDQVKVKRAKILSNDVAVFDVEVLGLVTIYGCFYREGKKKNGEDYKMVSFPSKKDNDGNYWNHAYFYCTDEVVKTICEQIAAIVD